MKSLNENWFAISLTAIVFGLIGFLFGRQNGHNKCPMMMGAPHAIHMEKMKGADVMFWKSDGDFSFGEHEGIKIDIDSIGSNGEKQVKVIVKKE